MIFSFGPALTSPDVLCGAFIVKGSVELPGRTMVLTPARWVPRPPGTWLGLSGRLDDGGRTFSGRETASCAQHHAPAHQCRDRHAPSGTPASVHEKGIDPARLRGYSSRR
jgi:hypothetical protein